MEDTRKEWLAALLKITGPVLDALENGELKQRLPLDFHAGRAQYAPLEAFGRSMLGLAPWLELDPAALSSEERKLQSGMRRKAVRCLEMAADPDSPDFMNFTDGGQPLVDAAFLAHALVRAQKALAGRGIAAAEADESVPGQCAGKTAGYRLEAEAAGAAKTAAMQPDGTGADMAAPLSASGRTRRHLADALRATRRIAAVNTNWLFFSAMVEAGLYVLGEEWDIMRVLGALRAFQEWYRGDGVYGDGPIFHWDYYNSFVIQPMYVDLVDLFAAQSDEIARMRPAVLARASRYASVLERMIGPDGSYPVVGRSICYRFGAFQMLAQAALQHRLEEHLSPASVRCGLTAVIRRVMSAPDMFDENGWLRPGVFGYQPELAEEYINTGSLYLCSAVFLPLGLAPEDPFWNQPDEDWSGRKVWAGGHISIDHAID